MNSIYSLTESQLKDKSIFKEIKEQAQDFIFHQDMREALELARKLTTQLKKFPRFKDEAKEFYTEYNDLIIRLKIVSIPLLRYEEVAELVQNYFIKALDDPDTDIEERIETRLMVLPEVIRDDLREILYGALKENREKIGNKQIKVKDEIETKQPFVKNWLLDYDREIGIEKQPNIQRLNYINQNRNAKNLSEKERDQLHRLLHFYDEMKPITFPTVKSKDIPSVLPPTKPKPQKGPEKIKKPETVSQKQKTEKEKTAPESKKEQQNTTSQNKLKAKYKNIKAAPERKMRTMKEDIKKIFK